LIQHVLKGSHEAVGGLVIVHQKLVPFASHKILRCSIGSLSRAPRISGPPLEDTLISYHGLHVKSLS
jgi:hypothetical protein